MRVTREKAAENRARIVETASRLFREKGLDGVGLDAIMKEAGLTQAASMGISHPRKISRPRRWRVHWNRAPDCRADIRMSPILCLIICPKAISQIARMALCWRR
jgi:Bacterial regulatory proteins, tetR family